jgi:integral membrane protein (TIGR00529 family)
MIALLKVTIIFGIIVVLISKNFPLHWALLGGSIIMGISFGLPINIILKSFLEAAIDWSTINLLLILYLIAVFESILKEKEVLKTMVNSLKSLIKDEKIRLISMPIIMGLLPSVGGALFSAPLLEESTDNGNLEPERKSYINYWFRHVWEPFLPIYPGIILVSALTQTPINILVKEALPYGLFVLAIGLLFAFYKMPSEEIASLEQIQTQNLEEENQEIIVSQNPVKDFIISFLPILILIFSVIFLHFDLLYVLLGIVLLLFIIFRFNVHQILNTLKTSIKPQNLILILGVMIFKKMLEVTGAVSDIAYSLNFSFIPTPIIFFLIPFIVGIFTGVTSASIGISFPILIKMLPYVNPLKYILLAFLSGFLGIMVSPMHLCLVLTREYFNADWNKIYKYIIKSGILLAIFIFLRFLI